MGGQRSEAFSGHPRGASHPPPAGPGVTRWEGSLEDSQGEGSPNTAAAAFISLLVICQAGQGHADCHWSEAWTEPCGGCQAQDPHPDGTLRTLSPNGGAYLSDLLFPPMLSGEVEGNKGSGR